MRKSNRFRQTQFLADLDAYLDKKDASRREFPKRWIISSIILIAIAIAYYYTQDDLTPDYLKDGYADDYFIIFIVAFFVLRLPTLIFPKRWIISSIILIAIATIYYFIRNDFIPDNIEDGYVDDFVIIVISAFFALKIPTLIKKLILFILEYSVRILFSSIVSLVCFIYGISPIDIIPDVVPILGLGDDAAVLLTGLYINFKILKIMNLTKKILIIGATILIAYGIHAIVTHFFT